MHYDINENLTPQEIEFWEQQYLEQIFYSLNLDKDKMLSGFNTKEEIREDWEAYLGDQTSDFATGSERIFYWLFNQFGKPNSSPVGSDMFFETYNAYVHIDIKTVTLANLGDFTKNIFVGDNQNSYEGNIIVKGKDPRPYKGHLPPFYTKKTGEKKICLTYFIIILYNEKNLDIQTIALVCMPNGKLGNVYGNKVISAGKNKGKIRFNYTQCQRFESLANQPSRIKVLLWNENMDKAVEKKFNVLKDTFDQQDKKIRIRQ
ncbi:MULTISPECIES: PDDEXK family nuclease [Bacillus cereus group]|uniref:hypothetical protein n=1 Tax=Bacillus cereus group TaxID=86661 RepID=UPI000BF697E7|nr:MULTISPECIES: hypothetical protein [Bacillus cereus group]MCD2335629.1 hypothetical protein [Bacillus cereus]MEB9458434.1 hypothetical protein [Bacillus anthracis]PFR75667.1 hypothetical protein COK29_14625 [Bacillus cereus]PGL92774.1 hypothetical protein CN936_20185 [Bacillus cereus]HEF5696034.1 hypothetical protein [Bacillus cereus]